MTASVSTLKMKTIALVGNPNSGKTTLFNALTGLRQKTANYPGVTVEKKEGLLTFASGESITVLDLPGTYSLLTRSMDEQVVHDVIMGRQEGTATPDLLVVIADASNLERNLFFVTQLIETGIPCVIALNMWDMVLKKKVSIDLAQLSLSLKSPVVPTVGRQRQGLDHLKAVIEKRLSEPGGDADFRVQLPAAVEAEMAVIQKTLESEAGLSSVLARGEALRLLGDADFRSAFFSEAAMLKAVVLSAQAQLLRQGIDAASVEAEARYGFVQVLCQRVMRFDASEQDSVSRRIDSLLTHRVWGFVFFFTLMALLFQAIFSWASIPMDWMSLCVERMGAWAGSLLPEGQLKSLVVDGVFAGVGGVVVFLPQIAILFFFISLFEDSGYMARAAFVLDRVMRKVGLSGKSFIPLLSSFACAVPSIMSTRTIEDRNDRFATILVAPLMSCSARLPVYALMIGAFIPSVKLAGFINLQGLVLFSMYALSITAGLVMASIFRKTLLKGDKAPFVLELPPYRMPDMRSVMLNVLEKSKQFLFRAGTIIFALSIVLWFLASYPRNNQRILQTESLKAKLSAELSETEYEERASALNQELKSEQVRESFAGRMGRAIEPLIQPLGYDWKIGIGLIASFAAREVLVSTLAIVYNVGEAGDSNPQLMDKLQHEVSPVTGKPVYTPLTAVSLMVFFVLACQCVSTIAIVRRETNSWRWPVFMVFYMTGLAWTGSFLVFQIGTRMGF